MRDSSGDGVCRIANNAAQSRSKKKDEIMKTKLILAAAALAAFTVVNAASAAEPFHSPKGKALADSLRKVPAVSSNLDLTKDRPIGNAKAWELARSLRTVVRAGPSIDLAHGPYPLCPPRNPRHEIVLRELRSK